MKKLLLLLMALMMIGGSRAMAEYTEEVWYTEALKESVVSAGNNLRLKNVIERAQQGEQIACLNKQLELNNQIIDGKIASVACTANSGINALNVALANLQNTVNQVIQPFIPENKVVTPPTIATTTAGA